MDTRFVSYKSFTLDCDLELRHGNLNFVHGTPSYFGLSFCEVGYIPFIGFWIMTDTRFVSGKHMTGDCDLDLGRENINFVHDTPSHLYLPEVWLNSLSRFFIYG